MRKIVLAFMALGLITVSCSKDDKDLTCESCTTTLNTKIELCDKGDGTYAYKVDGKETGIIEKSLLKEAGYDSPKEYVDKICQS
ncbi:hypothetical protein [Allomuricauda sp. NBRC 101325]|uniref:hypothetical protein n=1 Tax=Allomuricauda sp. NBRC 101325 TaxID=1113758 RepID=UPI0024A57B9E|nr:hypothetical protein [Muricauda sp. NBRC 101325]GLU43260.1 hypothetical protein Musp01_08840 [Muricauda sp. NBRC 101325]